MVLTLAGFLKQFSTHNINKNTFLRLAKVRVHNNLFTLIEYAQRKNLTQEQLQIIYDFSVTNKITYLNSFFQKSLHIPSNLNLQKDWKKWSSLKPNTQIPGNNENMKYKNIIRNLHYIEILQKTTTSIDNLRPYLVVLKELFNKNIIDYKLLTPSGIDLIKKHNFGSVMSGFYFRASIMNPFFIYGLSQKYFPKGSVFTPTLGWSSYAYAFCQNPNITEYVGVDVIPSVCSKTRAMCRKFHKPDNIYCKPSETLLLNKTFMKKYQNHFDIIFFSPPYYDLEEYSGKNQSTNMYKTYPEWLEEYWHNTIKLCQHVLSKQGKMCYIISGFNKNTQMISDMNVITKKYFKLGKSIPMKNSNVKITKHKTPNEMIFLWSLK